MATTRLMPLHTGKGRTVAEALGGTTDYVKNPEKTDGGELVSAYQCNPAIVDQEFLFSKQQYAAMTGRSQKEHDVIAYHLRQSFKPGEVTPELANLLCLENGLSVIDNPRPSRGSYGNWLGEKPPTVREHLERIIDAALTSCKDFDGFLTTLKAAGVEVKRGKHLAFKISGGKKFIRCSSLGEDYSEEAIVERISGKQIVAPKGDRTAPNLLIDIQSKMQQARSPGYERWASVFNLKEMAKTLNFLQEHGLMAYADLESACDAAV